MPTTPRAPFQNPGAYPEPTRSLLQRVDEDAFDQPVLGPFSPQEQAESMARLGSFVVHLQAVMGPLGVARDAHESEAHLAARTALEAAYGPDRLDPADALGPALEDAAVVLLASVDTLHVLSRRAEEDPTPEPTPHV